jgi:hypothetical protein
MIWRMTMNPGDVDEFAVDEELWDHDEFAVDKFSKNWAMNSRSQSNEE